jgi:hypothetical protein
MRYIIHHSIWSQVFTSLFESTNIRRQEFTKLEKNGKKKKVFFVVDSENKNERMNVGERVNSRTLYRAMECCVQMKCILGSNYHFPIAASQLFVSQFNQTVCVFLQMLRDNFGKRLLISISVFYFRLCFEKRQMFSLQHALNGSLSISVYFQSAVWDSAKNLNHEKEF